MQVMQNALKLFQSRRFFTLWFGIGIPPFLIGTAVVAFLRGPLFGVVTSLIIVFWTLETVLTTCRRCPYYGSTKCGIPSMATPLVLKKLPAESISRRRVRVHYYIDLAMILYVNVVYWQVPVLSPVVAFCSVVGWLVVFRRKKFHGLLFRLDSRDGQQASAISIAAVSLTVRSKVM